MQNNDVQKKEIIVRAAKELFFRFGFSKTSMEDIAGESGLAKPTLYYYYENKEAIFNEIVLEEAHNFIGRLDKVIAADIPADEKIRRFYQTVYKNLQTYAAELNELPESLCAHSPHGQPVINKIHEMLMSRLKTLLESGMREGVFEIKDKQAYTSTLLYMTGFLNLQWMRHEPEKLRNMVINSMIDILLNGLKRRP